MTNLKLERPLAFFDLETTGVNTSKDRIVEIAIVKLYPDGNREEYIQRINPEMNIPREASEVHGIYDKDVENEPTFKEVAEEIKSFLENCDVAGYNSNRFDLPLLHESFARAEIDIDLKNIKKVDVQQIFYKKEQRTLSAALKFYCDKDLENAHSALADVNATIDVLEAQLEKYEDLERDIDFLDKYTGSDEFVDYARRIKMKNGVAVFNFGKHKEKTVDSVFKSEPNYYHWIMKGDFAQDTKDAFTKIFENL